MERLPRKVEIKWRRSRVDKQGRTYLVLRLTWPDGTETDRGAGYRTEDEAPRLAARALLGQLDTESSASGSVADLLAAYVLDVETRLPEGRFAENEAIHAEHLGRHLGRLVPEGVTLPRLRSYLAARRQEPTRRGTVPRRATIWKELATLRRAFALARDEGRLQIGPPPLPPKKSLPNDRRPPRMVSSAEVAQLVATAYDWPGVGDGELLGALMSLLGWSGRRPVAILGLRYGDLSRLEEGVAYFERDKGGEGRGWGLLSAGAAAALRRLVDRRPGVGARHLFVGRGGRPIPPPHVSQYWMHAIAERAGVPDVTAYDLRKHACTRIVRALNGDLPAALRYTGHQSVRTLIGYLYATEDEAREAADRIGPEGDRRGDSASEESS